MATLVEEYISNIKPRIEGAIELSLGMAVAEEVKTIIQDKTEEVVYSYRADVGLKRRREAGGIKDRGHMDAVVSGLNLKIISTVPPQNLFGSSSSDNIAEGVEDGYSSYNMPYPRPYHKATEDEIDGSARIEGIIEEFVNSAL